MATLLAVATTRILSEIMWDQKTSRISFKIIIEIIGIIPISHGKKISWKCKSAWHKVILQGLEKEIHLLKKLNDWAKLKEHGKGKLYWYSRLMAVAESLRSFHPHSIMLSKHGHQSPWI